MSTTERQDAETRCTNCGDAIEVCDGCDEPQCGAPICYDCLHVALGQVMPQPHSHGG